MIRYGLVKSSDSESVLFAGMSSRIRFDQIHLLGEFTNEDGPFADDHFVVFCVGKDEIVAVPVDQKILGVIRNFSCFTGRTIDLELIGETTFKNRILWPAAFIGQPFLAYRNGFSRVETQLELPLNIWESEE